MKYRNVLEGDFATKNKWNIFWLAQTNTRTNKIVNIHETLAVRNIFSKRRTALNDATTKDPLGISERISVGLTQFSKLIYDVQNVGAVFCHIADN